MLFETSQQGNLFIVRPLDNRLDARSAESFKENLAIWIAQSHRIIVLDLARVTFVDSSGLGAMVAVLKMMGKDGKVAVCSLQAPVLALFKLTRMDKVFAIFADVEAAILAL